MNLEDYGFRRYMVYSMDFDSRAIFLEDCEDGWDQKPKEMHEANRQKVISELKVEFGGHGIEGKTDNFRKIGTKPFSLVAYHNLLFDDVRRAFIIGSYYPALVGACALAERLLNHLIIDLREFYKDSQIYKKVYRKNSFDNWELALSALKEWQAIKEETLSEFAALKHLRHRSIHFNPATYSTIKGDALAAVVHLTKIIDLQFSAWGLHPWLIEGTRGFVFIKREWECNPFVEKYVIPNATLVGPYFSMGFGNGPEVSDHLTYGSKTLSDEEFCALFNDRKPEQMAQFPDCSKS